MGDRSNSTDSLLGSQFRDPSLFRLAITHRSFCNEHELDATQSYERLEFLGDAVLELAISDRLYGLFPHDDEGELTKSRSSLVRDEVLARVARRLGLGDLIRVGRGFEDSGGREQASVLAAVLEATIAAIYLDKGMEAAREFIDTHMASELAGIIQGGPLPENPKSRLQEFLQGQGQTAPQYRQVHREGPDHSPIFTMEAVVDGEVVGTGRGGSKSEAERDAAAAALQSLEGV